MRLRSATPSLGEAVHSPRCTLPLGRGFLSGRFKSPDDLKHDFQQVLGGRAPSKVIHYCGSGVAACHNLLAMELAGLTGGKLYAGSWSEWQADPKRPREKG